MRNAQQTRTPPASGGEVVPIQRGAPVPAHLAEMLEESAGQGVSTAQEDNLVPLVYILQSNSPQAVARNPNYIEGGEPSAIWLRNAPEPIIKGDVGILFQPCHFSKDVVEWRYPREIGSGGGFIGRHDFEPGEDMDKFVERMGAKKVIPDARNPNSFSWVKDDKSEFVETRYHAGYVVREDFPPAPFLIPLSSTGHTFSRTWMFKMNQKLTPGKRVAASHAYLYRLKTVLKKNASGEWFGFDVDDGVPIWTYYKDEQDQVDALARGRALADAFEAGLKQAEAPVDAGGGASAPDSSHAEKVV